MQARSLYIKVGNGNGNGNGNGRHIDVCMWPRPSRSAWAETLQMHGFLYKHGITSKGRNFNSKV